MADSTRANRAADSDRSNRMSRIRKPKRRHRLASLTWTTRSNHSPSKVADSATSQAFYQAAFDVIPGPCARRRPPSSGFRGFTISFVVVSHRPSIALGDGAERRSQTSETRRKGHVGYGAVVKDADA